MKRTHNTYSYIHTYISIHLAQIYLGDCRVGVEKSPIIQLTNICDLPVDVIVQYESTSIRFRKTMFQIAARQTADMMFDYTPHKVNPDYRKQIAFVNAKNPENFQVVLVRANVIPNRPSNAADLFRIVTSFPDNQLDFDRIVVNCPSLRTFTVRNVSNRSLHLKVESLLPDEVRLFYESNEKDLNSSIAQSPVSPAIHVTPVPQNTQSNITSQTPNANNNNNNNTNSSVLTSPNSSNSANTTSSSSSNSTSSFHKRNTSLDYDAKKDPKMIQRKETLLLDLEKKAQQPPAMLSRGVSSVGQPSKEIPLEKLGGNQNQQQQQTQQTIQHQLSDESMETQATANTTNNPNTKQHVVLRNRTLITEMEDKPQRK